MDSFQDILLLNVSVNLVFLVVKETVMSYEQLSDRVQTSFDLAKEVFHK